MSDTDSFLDQVADYSATTADATTFDAPAADIPTYNIDASGQATFDTPDPIPAPDPAPSYLPEPAAPDAAPAPDGSPAAPVADDGDDALTAAGLATAWTGDDEEEDDVSRRSLYNSGAGSRYDNSAWISRTAPLATVSQSSSDTTGTLPFTPAECPDLPPEEYESRAPLNPMTWILIGVLALVVIVAVAVIVWPK